MNTIETILSRRSIRRYTSEKISNEDFTTLLKCGCAAPSAMNNQPWYFLVVEDRKVLDEIPNYHPYASMLREAAAAIIVLGKDPQNASSVYVAQDLAASTQNILLAAHALGLGGVWLGVYPREERAQELAKVIDIPKEYFPFSIIALGHPAESKGPRENYSEARVFWEKVE